MDSFWAIILFVIFAIISDRTGKKKPVPKRRVPNPGRRPVPDISAPDTDRLERAKLEIPELKGAPSLPELETVSQVQAEAEIIAQQEKYQEMLREKRRREQRRAEEAQQRKADKEAAAAVMPGLNEIQQAIVWSEILAKPRAYRRIR